MNICSGSGWEKCTCSAFNYNSQMLFKNNNKTLCRPLDYINFAKISPITIPNLSTAKSENKCTLQFWMFAYSYTPKGFEGITFEWENHNKITVTNLNNDDNKCKFTCHAINNENIDLEITINQWVFLSCAVDYR
jgi:hypothetical protein